MAGRSALRRARTGSVTIAPVDGEDLARDPGGLPAGEEQNGGRDVLRCAEALSVDRVEEALLAGLAVALPLRLRGGIGQHETGRHRVHGNAVRPELPGELPGQADESVLRGRIGLDARETRAKARAGRDGDDAAEPGPLHGRGSGLG